MIGNHFTRLTGSKRNLLALMASSAVFTAGCANMATTASNVNPLSSAASLSGTVHGGNQPVVGAVVNLWFAGQKGNPGVPPSLAATTTSDAAGSFSFVKDTSNGNTDTGNEFSCLATSDPVVYITTKGGNTQNNGNSSQSNSAASFLGIYGNCKELSAANHINLTEVTTVATMATVQQFFDPIAETLSADGTGQQFSIISKVPSTIALLVDSSAGTAVTSTTLAAAGGNIAPTVSVTATPESRKLNLIANVLSACINTATSASTSCTSLFSAAVPPNPSFTNNFQEQNFPAAADTLQAAYYLLTNPTSGGSTNQATIFGLAGGVSGPYQPALATLPSDWTIAINYASNSACGTSSGGSGGFISSPIDINIDAADNVWIANSQGGTGNLSEITTGGVPTTCVLLGSGGSQGGATIDSSNNVWIGSGPNLYKYNPISHSAIIFPTTVTPIGVTADGLGNIYFTAVTAGVGSLYEIIGGASSATQVPATQISSNVGTNPVRLMPDYQGNTTQSNIFVTSGSTFISKVTPGTGTGSLNGFLTSTINTSGNSYGISIGHSNSLFISNFDSSSIDGFGVTGGVYSNLSGYPFITPATAGIAAPTSVSIDGRQNVWIPNHTNGASTGSVSLIGTQGTATALSPSTGFQKDPTFFNSNRAMVVDQAGNVWVAGDGNNFITEIVGAGVPIFQPYSVGLHNGRFQTIP